MALSSRERRLSVITKGPLRATCLGGVVWCFLASAAISADDIVSDREMPGAATQVTADARDSAATYVTGLVQQAVPKLLTMPAIQRPDELRRLFEGNIDLPGMARFAMGRYWRQANDAERAEFVELFQALLVQTADKGLADYRGGKLSVLDTRAGDEGEVLVRSALNLQEGPSVRVDWSLRRDMGRLRIQDVVVEGISTRIALRDLFATVIQEKGGTVAALLGTIRELVRVPVHDEP